MKRCRRRAEDLVETLIDSASDALARMRIGRVAAGWAVVPDGAGGAVLAAWFGEGARDDRCDLSADRTPGGAALAGRTPQLAGDPGGAAGLALTADRAGRGHQCWAGCADGAVGCSGVDGAMSTAVEPDFEVVGVGDQAVRT
jgi:hypothetical protein